MITHCDTIAATTTERALPFLVTAADQPSAAPAGHDFGTWLISLRSATERRQRMHSQLAAMGLQYRVFDAVDGRANEAELLKEVDQNAYERNMGSQLLPGKMGVYASHIGVWQEFLASPYSTALILEDDVVFHADFQHAVSAAMSTRDHWDIIRFNCIRAKLPVKQFSVGQYRANAYIGPFTGNATYLITREAAARILPNLKPQTRALDHELNRFFIHDYRQLGLEPWASHPDDNGTSTITGKDFAKVKKPHWSKRLPHYRLKAANYRRRAWWLMQHGMVFKRSRAPVHLCTAHSTAIATLHGKERPTQSGGNVPDRPD